MYDLGRDQNFSAVRTDQLNAVSHCIYNERLLRLFRDFSQCYRYHIQIGGTHIRLQENLSHVSMAQPIAGMPCRLRLLQRARAPAELS